MDSVTGFERLVMLIETIMFFVGMTIAWTGSVGMANAAKDKNKTTVIPGIQFMAGAILVALSIYGVACDPVVPEITGKELTVASSSYTVLSPTDKKGAPEEDQKVSDKKNTDSLIELSVTSIHTKHSTYEVGKKGVKDIQATDNGYMVLMDGKDSVFVKEADILSITQRKEK